jgi:hypothetical protein
VTPQPLTEPELLNAKELMARLGFKKSRFHVLRKQGHFRHLETKRPVGTRIYSKALVDRYLTGESTVQFVRRAS